MLENNRNTNFVKTTLPVFFSVFLVFLTIGMALGVIPSFVQRQLGFNSFIVGLVIGLQSIFSLLSRPFVGKLIDTKGAKYSYFIGIVIIMVTGLIYFSAAKFYEVPILSLSLLLLARITHGISESLLLTGSLAWGIGLAGSDKSGKVMSWNGIAIYGGIAVGAPLSIYLTNQFGISISYVFLSIVLLPLIGWLLTIKLPSVAVNNSTERIPFYKVLNLIFKEGSALALSSIAYGCIISFITLFFLFRNWDNAPLAFGCFGLFYVLTRVFGGNLPDKYGGFIVAVISMIIEIAGQLLIAFSFSETMAIVGCALTGIGTSLIFPALGVLAIKRVAPQMRGTALGAYSAFFDISLGIAGPVAGIIVGWSNYQAIYLFGGISCLLAVLVLLFHQKSYRNI